MAKAKNSATKRPVRSKKSQPTKKDAGQEKKALINDAKNIDLDKEDTMVEQEKPDHSLLSRDREAADNKIVSTPVASPETDKDKINSRPINIYRKIAVSFIVLTLILLAVVVYFSYVKLTIILIPSQERISDKLIIDIYNKDRGPQAAVKALTGVVEEIEISKEGIYPGSGTEIISAEVVGQVKIINDYNKNQPLVATTRLLSGDNKLYRLKNTVNVPAGGSLAVEIYADQPGREMAIGPTKFTIPGLWAGLQDKIYGQSQEAFTYSQQVKKYIQQVDIDQAVKALKKEMLAKAKVEIGESYQGYDKVIYSLNENTIRTEVDGKVNEEKDNFKVSLKAKVNVIAFSGQAVSNLARTKLLGLVPDDKELIEFSKDEMVYILNNYNIKQGVAAVEIAFEGRMALKEGADIIDRNKIVGLNQEQLEDYLNSFREIAGYEIKFSPGFVDKVPNLVDRIKIEIKK